MSGAIGAPGARILVLGQDDSSLAHHLEEMGHEVTGARTADEALSYLHDVDLALIDILVPGLDGFEAARSIRATDGGAALPIVVVTGTNGVGDRARAREVRANDFVARPIDPLFLETRLRSLLRAKKARDELARHEQELVTRVERRTEALRAALESVAEAQRSTYEAQLDTIHRLAVAAEYKDQDTASHLLRIQRYCELIANGMGLSPMEVEEVALASPMHDVGKIGIPDRILFKPGPLTDDEWAIMRQHSIIGARILSGSTSPLLRAGEVIARSHHERWDGAGYPDGLRGEAIPLPARICAVADVFDVLTSRRPYKEALPAARAAEILSEARGGHFDPDVVDVFLNHLDEVLKIESLHREEGGPPSCPPPPP